MGTTQSSETPHKNIYSEEKTMASSDYPLSEFENDFIIFSNKSVEEIKNYYKQFNDEDASKVTIGLRILKESGLTTKASKIAVIRAGEHAVILALALEALHDAGVEITTEICMLLLKAKEDVKEVADGIKFLVKAGLLINSSEMKTTLQKFLSLSTFELFELIKKMLNTVIASDRKHYAYKDYDSVIHNISEQLITRDCYPLTSDEIIADTPRTENARRVAYAVQLLNANRGIVITDNMFRIMIKCDPVSKEIAHLIIENKLTDHMLGKLLGEKNSIALYIIEIFNILRSYGFTAPLSEQLFNVIIMRECPYTAKWLKDLLSASPANTLTSANIPLTEEIILILLSTSHTSDAHAIIKLLLTADFTQRLMIINALKTTAEKYKDPALYFINKYYDEYIPDFLASLEAGGLPIITSPFFPDEARDLLLQLKNQKIPLSTQLIAGIYKYSYDDTKYFSVGIDAYRYLATLGEIQLTTEEIIKNMFSALKLSFSIKQPFTSPMIANAFIERYAMKPRQYVKVLQRTNFPISAIPAFIEIISSYLVAAYMIPENENEAAYLLQLNSPKSKNNAAIIRVGQYGEILREAFNILKNSMTDEMRDHLEQFSSCAEFIAGIFLKCRSSSFYRAGINTVSRQLYLLKCLQLGKEEDVEENKKNVAEALQHPGAVAEALSLLDCQGQLCKETCKLIINANENASIKARELIEVEKQNIAAHVDFDAKHGSPKLTRWHRASSFSSFFQDAPQRESKVTTNHPSSPITRPRSKSV